MLGKTLSYYQNTIEAMICGIGKTSRQITTDDIRQYLIDYQVQRGSSRVTIDNISKAPQFISSRVEFTVILKNLNYEEDRDDEYEMDETSQRVEEYIQRTEDMFLNALRKNPNISRRELAKMLMLSEEGVKYHLKKLKNKGLIERVGASRGGYWKVK